MARSACPGNSGNLRTRFLTPRHEFRPCSRALRKVFANGSELEFEPASRPVLESGTWTFEDGSFTTLHGNLLLENTLVVFQFGADINGSGALINTAGRQFAAA